MIPQQEWNVVFLLNQDSPTKIVMLKRAPTKSFAPNFYTGVGGKVEPQDKSVLESAYRELREETGIEGVLLTQFAQCVINDQNIIHYFWGIYPYSQLPSTEDGTLEWVEKGNVLDKEIIPTTYQVCQEWLKRGIALSSPFTVYVKGIRKERTVEIVELDKVENGLL